MKALLILFLFLHFSNGYTDEINESSLYAIVDVETTGLNPNYHEMIDIGTVSYTHLTLPTILLV